MSSDKSAFRVQYCFQTISSLSEALQALEKVGRTSATVDVAKGTKLEDTPSADEIDEITIVMKRFLAKLRVQVYNILVNCCCTICELLTGLLCVQYCTIIFRSLLKSRFAVELRFTKLQVAFGV